jgi:DnaJ like chaperone protein
MELLKTTKRWGRSLVNLIFTRALQQATAAATASADARAMAANAAFGDENPDADAQALQVFVRNVDVFTRNLLVLSAAIIKADGCIKSTELKFINDFFVRNYGDAYANERMVLFNIILNEDLPIEEICIEFRQTMDYISCLRLTDLLYQVAQADGEFSAIESATLGIMADALGIFSGDLVDIYNKNTDFALKLAPAAYKQLGVLPTATNDIIKTAYRKQAMAFHPDKFMHLGETLRKEAEIKFRNLQEAYQKIKYERCMA